MDIAPLRIHSSLMDCFDEDIFRCFCNEIKFHILSRDGKCLSYQLVRKSQFRQKLDILPLCCQPSMCHWLIAWSRECIVVKWLDESSCCSVQELLSASASVVTLCSHKSGRCAVELYHASHLWYPPFYTSPMASCALQHWTASPTKEGCHWQAGGENRQTWQLANAAWYT